MTRSKRPRRVEDIARAEEARRRDTERWIAQCERRDRRVTITRCDYYGRTAKPFTWLVSPRGERDRQYLLTFQHHRYLVSMNFTTAGGIFQLVRQHPRGEELILRRIWHIDLGEDDRHRVKTEMHEQMYLCMRHLQGVLDSSAVLNVL